MIHNTKCLILILLSHIAAVLTFIPTQLYWNACTLHRHSQSVRANLLGAGVVLYRRNGHASWIIVWVPIISPRLNWPYFPLSGWIHPLKGNMANLAFASLAIMPSPHLIQMGGLAVSCWRKQQKHTHNTHTRTHIHTDIHTKLMLRNQASTSLAPGLKIVISNCL